MHATLSFILAAAEGAHEAAEEHESKTAFYVAGGVLAVWAVLISAVGITRPDFPGKSGMARAVMGFTALLVATAMATAVLTA